MTGIAEKRGKEKRTAVPGAWWRYPAVFLLAFLMAWLSLSVILVRHHGLLTLCNDYQEQYIPFTMLFVRSVHTGTLPWSWSIDIGSSLLASSSYYGSTSPFSWLALLVPARYVIYGMPYLICLKYAVAALNAFWYLRRHVRREQAALAGAILYAFSGFQATDLLFYCFLDATAFFPLLLCEADRILERTERDPRQTGRFALAVLLQVLANYYLFMEEVLFLVLYFLVRVSVQPKGAIRKFLVFLREGLLGAGLSLAVLLPSLLQLTGNQRISHRIARANWLDTGRRYFLKLFRFFCFPAEPMGRGITIEQDLYSSWSAYLPLVGVLLVSVYLISYRRKRDWLHRLLLLLLLAAAVPVLNSAFGFFADSNYKRWYFMLVLMMALASARVLEEGTLLHRYRFLLLALTALFWVSLPLFVWWDQNRFPLIFDRNAFLVLSLVGCGGYTVLSAAAFLPAENWNRCLKRILLPLMAAVAVVTTGYTAVLYQNANGEEPEHYYARILAYMDLQDAMEGGYRMDTQENTVTMTAGLPGDGCFSSTISGNIFRFYSAAGEERSVFTPEGPEGKTALFSAAYYLAGEPSNPEDETVVELGGSRKGTFLYRKKEVLPVGAFVYDSPEELDFSEGKKITDWLLSNRLAGADAKETYEDAALGTNSCRITLKLDRKGYALFSIPADYGWEATVNGKKAQIQEKNGLILIPVQAGTNTIHLHYTDKAFLLGAAGSGFSLALLLLLRVRREHAALHGKSGCAGRVGTDFADS